MGCGRVVAGGRDSGSLPWAGGTLRDYDAGLGVLRCPSGWNTDFRPFREERESMESGRYSEGRWRMRF